jgi:hypothetical protein
MLMSYGYVLALAAGGRERPSLLDRGGGIGHYLPVSRALLPGVEIDYHCKGVPVLAEHGRELFPEAHFYDDDSCLEGRYDLVLASGALQYAPDWKATFAALAGATSGLLYVTLAPVALHHIPIGDPNVAGEKLRYHVFVFMHAAAIAQVTGVPLDLVFLRWLPIMAVLLLALEVAWLTGRASGGSPWIAPAAVALTLFASELDVDPDRAYPFLGLFFTNIPLSPTFAFGLPVFVAAAGMIVGILARRAPVERGAWVVLGLLLAGAMGAKATTLPVMLVGLGLFLFARLLLDRVLDRRAVAVLALTFVTFVAVYVALLSGTGNAGAKIGPFAFLHTRSWARRRDSSACWAAPRCWAGCWRRGSARCC